MKTGLRYVDELVGLRAAPDLLALRLFPNAKEVTESFGAYAAARDRLRDVELSDPSVLVVAVGDGVAPRTGAVFAFRSAWTCLSVDPRIRDRWVRGGEVRRLTALRARVEDVEVPSGFDTVVLVCVRSHAKMSAAVRAASGRSRRLFAVSVPCCVPSDIRPPDLSYEDPGIASPQRRVEVWRLEGAP
jgi:hypothetical protein